MNKLPPLSLYIHIPWCLKKCPYCDFNSYQLIGIIPEKKYIYHLLKDLEQHTSLIKNRIINSIFIGGGTPSLIHPNTIKYLIDNIKNIVNISDIVEITIEMNPKIQEIEYIPEYQYSGINRISIGIQSFDSDLLKKIGRNYNKFEAHKAIELAMNVPLININLDIMHGLPTQSIQSGISDLQQAIQYSPNHLSWYQLTIEPNTIFQYKKPKLPSEYKLWTIFKNGNKLLKQSGYHQYEISAYSKTGYKCKHNLNYWRYGDYLGIGCGAHSKITNDNGKIIRIIKKKQIVQFMNGKYIEKIYSVELKDRIFEYFLNHFRIFEPISKKKFQEHTGINPKNIQNEINTAILNKYLIQTNTHWKTTNKGKLFLNNLLEIFIT
ncbi:Heme chaperone HemW [Buchnera aphidicola (Eriosoma lanigerum)]|uniref:radical SAM family heme chaperone HemW n=1 Tax=Buchnera aphidicola TaxID=9 RepID=UPI003463DFC1